VLNNHQVKIKILLHLISLKFVAHLYTHTHPLMRFCSESHILAPRLSLIYMHEQQAMAKYLCTIKSSKRKE